MLRPGDRLIRFGWVVVLVIAVGVGCNRTAPSPKLPSAGLTASVTYVADSQTRIVHRSDCECIAQIEQGDQVPFKLLPDALAERYTPCKQCLAKMRGGKDKP